MTVRRLAHLVFACVLMSPLALAQQLPRVGESIEGFVQVDLSGYLDNETESGPSQTLRGQGNISGNASAGSQSLTFEGGGAVQWRRTATQRLAARRALRGNALSFVRLTVTERTTDGLRVSGDVFFCLPGNETGSGPLTPPSSCYGSESNGGNPQVLMGETRGNTLPGYMGETGGGNPEVFKLELEGTVRGN